MPSRFGTPTMGEMTRARTSIVVVAVAAVLATVLVLVTALGGESKKAKATTKVPAAALVNSMLRGIPQSGAVLGSPRAPVTLVEYADLQCPFCADWANLAVPELVRDYVRPGKVKLVFRGLAFIGPDSETALRTAVAAGKQNRLWNVLELLYSTQGRENSGWVTDELLSSIGASVPGLDGARMLADRSSGGVSAAMQAAARQANAAGIQSTPSFQAGHSGGPLQVIRVQSLAASGIAPALDELLVE
jgi:protein-disulfide isomerase